MPDAPADLEADRRSDAPPRDPQTDKAEPSPEDDRKRRRGRVRSFLIAGLVLLILVVAGVLYWLHARHFESTDDAEIDGLRTQMAAQVSGRVLALRIADNQHVTEGQVLLRIDPRDYEVRLAQTVAQQQNAAASVQQAAAQLANARASAAQADAQVRASDASSVQAGQDFRRFHAIDPAATTRQQIDNATATYRGSAARLEASRRAADGAAAQVRAAAAQLAAAQATLEQARASVDNAKLQLSYTIVTAPASGFIATRTVNVGDYINPGQALFAIVQDELWVTANFKETQLDAMRPGQDVRIEVDAFPGRHFHGRVDSIQRGTGQAFSLLPAENATGNYVKVTQRVPVKIVFDDPAAGQVPLGLGMSVTPRVTVR